MRTALAPHRPAHVSTVQYTDGWQQLSARWRELCGVELRKFTVRLALRQLAANTRPLRQQAKVAQY